MKKYKTKFIISAIINLLLIGLLTVFWIVGHMKQGYLKDESEGLREEVYILREVYNQNLKSRSEIHDYFKIKGITPFYSEQEDESMTYSSTFIFVNDTLIGISPNVN